MSAYQRATGALWHAEVARGQFDAAAFGSPDLRGAAHGHIDRAIADLDALARAGVDLPSFRAAALGDESSAPAALDALTPHLRTVVRTTAGAVDPAHLPGVRPMSLAPTRDVDHSERGAVLTAASARRMNQVSSTQRAARVELLATGRTAPEPIGWVGGNGNANGAMAVQHVHDGAAALLATRAVHRPITAKPAQEQYHYAATATLGVDHLIAPVGRRADGTVFVELVPGRPAWDASQNIADADDVRGTLEHGYRLHYPNLPEDEVRLAARIDQELLMYADWRTANVDRNLGSIVADRAHGRISFFDGGEVGQGETLDVTRPAMRDRLAIGGRSGEVTLADETLAEIAARDTDSALAAQHAHLLDPRGDATPGGTGRLLHHLRDPGFLRANIARRDAALADGKLHYAPIAEDANPLDAAYELRGRSSHSWSS